MSYSIYIGQAEIEGTDTQEKYFDGELIARYKVNQVNNDNAPVFIGDEMTGNGNSRHPGYLQWDNFCKKASLHDFFFDEDHGLMRSHPGAFVIAREHHGVIKTALDSWKSRHPNTEPGFTKSHDGVLARLIWLDFWFDWALSNCQLPAIYNH